MLTGAKVRALFRGQRPDGGFGVHPYRKWTGAHWRLVSMVELAVPRGESRAAAAAGAVLDWLAGRGRLDRVTTIDGLVRRCASMEGNALAACSRLGLATDERVAALARHLVDWQWPDGGWNCDPRASGRRSSFHESLPPMWGLTEYARATGAAWAQDAAESTAELLLQHRIYRSRRDGDVIDRRWLEPRYPPYWHYDVLQALVILARMGRARDPRASEAVEHVSTLRDPDGTWRPRGYWWSPPGAARTPEIVDWDRGGPSEMLTLNALRVLQAAR